MAIIPTASEFKWRWFCQSEMQMITKKSENSNLTNIVYTNDVQYGPYFPYGWCGISRVKNIGVVFDSCGFFHIHL